jgi:stearoyl-CoA desaturase (delta-9 desaturase)
MDYAQTAWPSVRDWNRYPELRWLNRYHWVPGLLLGAGCFWIGGWKGLVWGWVVSTVLVYHATFTVNSLCHRFGRRRYATQDDSRNNWLVALLTLGEGWHNNHHHYQASARQGFVWWQFDVSYYTLRLLELCGVVWDIRVPPRSKVLAPGPQTAPLFFGNYLPPSEDAVVGRAAASRGTNCNAAEFIQ